MSLILLLILSSKPIKLYALLTNKVMDTVDVQFELDFLTEVRLKKLKASLEISNEEIIYNAVQYYRLLCFCALSNNQIKLFIVKDNH